MSRTDAEPESYLTHQMSSQLTEPVVADGLNEAQDAPQATRKCVDGQNRSLISGFSLEADSQGRSEEDRDCVTLAESQKSAKYSVQKRLSQFTKTD